MAEKLLNAKVLQRIDTLANWNASNPVLRKGEICIISDTNEIKIGDGTSTFKNLKAVTISGNSGSATKLETARTIALGNGVTSTATSFNGESNITIPVTGISESYLTWGGKNFSSSYGPIDAALVPSLGANRLAFGKAEGIKVEYSRDNGATWTDYGLSDNSKVALFSSGGSATIGKSTNVEGNKPNANCQLRIIIDWNKFHTYSILNKWVIYVSTNGSSGCWCTIESDIKATGATTVFANKVPVSGWSGYNVINTNGMTTYGNTPSTQYGTTRLIFGCTGISSTGYNGLTVSLIMAFGGVGWTTPSTMAKTGHLYAFDSNQNATFPANVTATQFKGALSGNANTASKLKTPRNIKFSGDINGETTFDGSTDASIDITVNKISGQTSINNESSIQDILNWLSNVSSK